MKTKHLIYIACLFLVALTTSCEKPIIPGISDEEMLQDQLLGGWETIDVKAYISHSSIPGTGSLSEKMQQNLEGRVYPSYFYITKDSIFFIQLNESKETFVKSASAYQLATDPMRIIPENQYMMCDEYAPYFYIKSEGETICFYLTKNECLDMIEKDGSFDGFMGLVKRFIQDAQFEFYFKQNNDLPIYQQIENGDYPRDDHFKNK